jgi:hypothetical protein
MKEKKKPQGGAMTSAKVLPIFSTRVLIGRVVGRSRDEASLELTVVNIDSGVVSEAKVLLTEILDWSKVQIGKTFAAKVVDSSKMAAADCDVELTDDSAIGSDSTKMKQTIGLNFQLYTGTIFPPPSRDHDDDDVDGKVVERRCQEARGRIADDCEMVQRFNWTIASTCHHILVLSDGRLCTEVVWEDVATPQQGDSHQQDQNHQDDPRYFRRELQLRSPRGEKLAGSIATTFVLDPAGTVSFLLQLPPFDQEIDSLVSAFDCQLPDVLIRLSISYLSPLMALRAL